MVNIILGEGKDRPIRLRRALLGLSMSVPDAKVPTKVTMESVKSKWPLLSTSMVDIRSVLDFANSHSINEIAFERIMKSLNSYL